MKKTLGSVDCGSMPMGGRGFGSSGREVDRWEEWRGAVEETGRGE